MKHSGQNTDDKNKQEAEKNRKIHTYMRIEKRAKKRSAERRHRINMFNKYVRTLTGKQVAHNAPADTRDRGHKHTKKYVIRKNALDGDFISVSRKYGKTGRVGRGEVWFRRSVRCGRGVFA